MRPVILAALGLALATGPALAHHPFASEFDSNAPVTLSGTVMSVDWNDPHVMIHVAVKDTAGKTEDWSMEAASPNGMKGKGWTQAMLKQGAQITVHGYRAKSEPFVITARMIELPGGQKMSSAANDGGPQT